MCYLEGGCVKQLLLFAKCKGTVTYFQTFTEVDEIGFTCKYQLIADYKNFLKETGVYLLVHPYWCQTVPAVVWIFAAPLLLPSDT